MNRILKLSLALVLSSLWTGCAASSMGASIPLQGPIATSGHVRLEVTSRDFEADQALGQDFAFDQFGCTGQNRRPHLAWGSVPPGTKSIAVIVHDPDAPTGVGFFHWVAINIPAATRELGAELPQSVKELHTDYGVAGYGGPCPPPGRNHRYVFSVFALSTEIELPPGATGALTRFVIAEHTLAHGQIVGTYRRP